TKQPASSTLPIRPDRKPAASFLILLLSSHHQPNAGEPEDAADSPVAHRYKPATQCCRCGSIPTPRPGDGEDRKALLAPLQLSPTTLHVYVPESVHEVLPLSPALRLAHSGRMIHSSLEVISFLRFEKNLQPDASEAGYHI